MHATILCVRPIKLFLTQFFTLLLNITLALGLFAPGLLAANVVAQALQQTAPPITLVIEAGFNAYSKSSAWMPLRISLNNTGDALEGQLVLVSEKAPEVFERFEQDRKSVV